MERFAFKIDKVLKANLYKICRLCGIDNPEKVPIFIDSSTDIIDLDAEPELPEKIKELIGFTVFKDDKMPQYVCTLCVEKINDFHEFREMCYSTDAQTRKLLGIKSAPKIVERTTQIKVEVKTEPVSADKRAKKRRFEDSDVRTEIKEEVDKSVAASKKKKMPNQKTLGDSKDGLEIKHEITETANITNTPTENNPKLKQLCTICNERFSTKGKLERHRNVSHIPTIKKHFCTTCHEEIKKNSEYKSHQLWHKLSQTPYTCGLCGEALSIINLYTRHLSNHTQKLATPVMVFDRECPKCHEIFVTNFHFNTHACAVRAKKCGGCNRKMNTDAEYQRHAPHCDKIYLVASKHILGVVENIRIKNENDVEAAAANSLSQDYGVPLAMMPVVSLTRLAIDPQKMNISSGVTSVTNATNAKSKKSNKKGMSKKDLKRVDDLLKSTMNTLVSIKHEPEIHVDAEPQNHTTSTLSQANVAVDMEHENSNAAAEDESMHWAGDDDFQNRDDDDDSNQGGIGAALVPIVQLHTDSDITIKQEPHDDQTQTAHDVSKTNTISIKKEKPDNGYENNTNALAASKVPALKLKITKEHGTLNSSLVNDNSENREKKKKKKKRKDTEKLSENENNNQEDTTNSQPTESETPIMPQPGLIRIKQERSDDGYIDHNVLSQSVSTQPEATIMTSIPLMQFQISCVSSGVEFDKSDEQQKETDPAAAANEYDEQIQEQTEPIDVKPNRQELDRLLAENQNHNKAASGDATKQPSQLMQKTVSKRVATKSTNNRKPNNTTQIPKIVAVSSGIELPKASDQILEGVRVKTEPQDDEYYAVAHDEQHELETFEDTGTPNDTTTTTNMAQDDEEQAYINNIDFSKVRIKQEKEIDVSESQVTVPHFSNVSPINGLTTLNKEYESEEESDEMDKDDDEDVEDDSFENIPQNVEENREYREIDLPPAMLNELEVHEKSSISAQPPPPLGLVIASVCSQAVGTFAAASEPNEAEKSKIATSPVPTTEETTVSGCVIESGEQLLNAQPVSDTVQQQDNAAETAELTSTSIDEEEQNILNHEMSAAASCSAMNTNEQPQTNEATNSEMIQANSDLSENVSLSSCSNLGNHIGIENLSTSCGGGGEQSKTETTTKTILKQDHNEETDNLFNESVLRQQNMQNEHSQLNLSQQQRSSCSISGVRPLGNDTIEEPQRAAVLLDSNNVNEIAENNNNANIERELLDDHHNLENANVDAPSNSTETTSNQ